MKKEFTNTGLLIKALINHYERNIKAIEKLKSIKRIWDLLVIERLNYGVCFCAERTFSTDVYNAEWIKEHHNKNRGYWYTTPANCETKDQLLEVLKYRLINLKLILNESEY